MYVIKPYIWLSPQLKAIRGHNQTDNHPFPAVTINILVQMSMVDGWAI